MAPLWPLGGPLSPFSLQRASWGSSGGNGGLGALPLARASPSLASPALGAFPFPSALVVCGSVVRGEGSVRWGAIASECVRRGPIEGLGRVVVLSAKCALSPCQKAGVEDGCAGPPRGCLRWREGGPRPPIDPDL